MKEARHRGASSMNPRKKPRWQYRFDNYKRAFVLLREALEEDRELSQLEQEGVIQRFEYTMELAWKVMKEVAITWKAKIWSCRRSPQARSYAPPSRPG